MTSIAAATPGMAVAATPVPAWAPEWTLAAVLDFPVGSAAPAAEHLVALDQIRERFPLAQHEFYFEGDHDPIRYRNLSPQASSRLNERLAETRWQLAALHLGVAPVGTVRVTGQAQARIFVRRRAEALAVPAPMAHDVPPAIDGEKEALRARLRGLEEANARLAQIIETRVVPDTVYRGIELELAEVRVEKRTGDRFYESFGRMELGLFRTIYRGQRQHSGVLFAAAGGSNAWSGLQLSLVFDDFGFGSRRWHFSPVLTWYDGTVRAAIGSDEQAETQLFYAADPAVTVGFRLEAAPWGGSSLRVHYLGVGAQVHSTRRPLRSFDLAEARFGQDLRGPFGVEGIVAFDERYDKELSYIGGFGCYGLQKGHDRYSMRIGLVRQLAPADPDHYVNAASFGVTYRH
jgi:hypothetical protein